MKRFSLALFAGAVATVLLSGTAKAAPVPWSYNFQPGSVPGSITVASDNPGSYLTLSDEPGRTVNTDHTFITATNILTTSNAPTGFPDEFTQHGNVTFTLFFKDVNSNTPMTFKFTGTFNTTDPMNPSTLSADSSLVQFTPTGIQNVTQVLGQNEYNIKFYSYSPPGPPNPPMPGQKPNAGSIAYQVTVRNLDIQKAPEPSTMILAGLGASFMSFSAWRKRRKQANQIAIV